MPQIQLPVSNQVKEIFMQVTLTSPLEVKRVIKATLVKSRYETQTDP